MWQTFAPPQWPDFAPPLTPLGEADGVQVRVSGTRPLPGFAHYHDGGGKRRGERLAWNHDTKLWIEKTGNPVAIRMACA